MSESVDHEKMLQINHDAWNTIASRFYGVTALPTYGPLTPTEVELQLLGEVQGKRILEIGCGSGHSLAYLATQGVGELWGLDLSSTQIEAASHLHQEQGLTSHLFCSPMEENPGLPENYFDLVFFYLCIGMDGGSLTDPCTHCVISGTRWTFAFQLGTSAVSLFHVSGWTLCAASILPE